MFLFVELVDLDQILVTVRTRNLILNQSLFVVTATDARRKHNAFIIFFRSHSHCNKSEKGLPLETKSTQYHESRRLGLIESLHMQHCSMRGCLRPLAPVERY